MDISLQSSLLKNEKKIPMFNSIEIEKYFSLKKQYYKSIKDRDKKKKLSVSVDGIITKEPVFFFETTDFLAYDIVNDEKNAKRLITIKNNTVNLLDELNSTYKQLDKYFLIDKEILLYNIDKYKKNPNVLSVEIDIKEGIKKKYDNFKEKYSKEIRKINFLKNMIEDVKYRFVDSNNYNSINLVNYHLQFNKLINFILDYQISDNKGEDIPKLMIIKFNMLKAVFDSQGKLDDNKKTLFILKEDYIQKKSKSISINEIYITHGNIIDDSKIKSYNYQGEQHIVDTSDIIILDGLCKHKFIKDINYNVSIQEIKDYNEFLKLNKPEIYNDEIDKLVVTQDESIKEIEINTEDVMKKYKNKSDFEDLNKDEIKPKINIKKRLSAKHEFNNKMTAFCNTEHIFYIDNDVNFFKNLPDTRDYKNLITKYDKVPNIDQYNELFKIKYWRYILSANYVHKSKANTIIPFYIDGKAFSSITHYYLYIRLCDNSELSYKKRKISIEEAEKCIYPNEYSLESPDIILEMYNNKMLQCYLGPINLKNIIKLKAYFAKIEQIQIAKKALILTDTACLIEKDRNFNQKLIYSNSLMTVRNLISKNHSLSEYTNLKNDINLFDSKYRSANITEREYFYKTTQEVPDIKSDLSSQINQESISPLLDKPTAKLILNEEQVNNIEKRINVYIELLGDTLIKLSKKQIKDSIQDKLGLYTEFKDYENSKKIIDDLVKSISMEYTKKIIEKQDELSTNIPSLSENLPETNLDKKSSETSTQIIEGPDASKDVSETASNETQLLSDIHQIKDDKTSLDELIKKQKISAKEYLDNINFASELNYDEEETAAFIKSINEGYIGDYKNLEKILQSNLPSYKIMEIPPDGDCLYYSIVEVLNIKNITPMRDSDSEDTLKFSKKTEKLVVSVGDSFTISNILKEAALELRKIIYNKYNENLVKASEFIPQEKRANYGKNIKYSASSKDPDKKGDWGDELEISLISALFNLNITVYKSDTNIFNYKAEESRATFNLGDEYNNDKIENIYLGYLVNTNHYVSLIDKREELELTKLSDISEFNDLNYFYTNVDNLPYALLKDESKDPIYKIIGLYDSETKKIIYDEEIQRKSDSLTKTYVSNFDKAMTNILTKQSKIIDCEYKLNHENNFVFYQNQKKGRYEGDKIIFDN